MSVAIHILLYLEEYEEEEKVTSEVLADTTGVNAVNIRKTLQLLKKAGFIEIRRGVGGACLKKAPEAITVRDISRQSRTPMRSCFTCTSIPIRTALSAVPSRAYWTAI